MLIDSFRALKPAVTKGLSCTLCTEQSVWWIVNTWGLNCEVSLNASLNLALALNSDNYVFIDFLADPWLIILYILNIYRYYANHIAILFDSGQKSCNFLRIGLEYRGKKFVK